MTVDEQFVALRTKILYGDAGVRGNCTGCSGKAPVSNCYCLSVGSTEIGSENDQLETAPSRTILQDLGEVWACVVIICSMVTQADAGPFPLVSSREIQVKLSVT